MATKKKTTTTKKTKSSPVKELSYTRVALVFDKSGSMRGFGNTAKEALLAQAKGFVDSVKQFDNALVELSVILFDSSQNVLLENQHPDQELLKKLSKTPYYPGGGTALFDAVALAKDTLEKTPTSLSKKFGKEKTAYIVITVTDGEENRSVKYDSRSFKKFITDAGLNWSFVFALPKTSQCSYKDIFVKNYGISPENCTEWETSVEGLKDLSTKISAGTMSYIGTRSMSPHVYSTNTFYADLSKVDKSVLAKNFKEVHVNNQLTNVEDTSKEIRKFVNECGLKFSTGEWFYRLRKSEKVQPYKVVLIRDVVTNKFYAGATARKLLGIPTDREIRLRPSTYKKQYEVFVQSTSVNRKIEKDQMIVQLNSSSF